ncbi:hypothetical protein N7470_001335 [Penicillium chermesinum]|nr:hypothetical protein N7470_001335 [Penicillium chermesinum]
MIQPSLPNRACGSACSSLQALVRGGGSASANSASVLAGSAFFHNRSKKQNPQSRRAFHSTSILFSQSTSSSRISYRVAASSSGKGRRFHPVDNAYNFDPSVADVIGVSKDKNPVTRRKSRPDSGEDAFFVSKTGKSRHSQSDDAQAVAFAVADGVGGWAESRVDPADFSHGICGAMAKAALSWDESAEKLRPRQLLQDGYDQVVADPSVKAGGSTASVGVALPDGRVELANLGDSGSVLLRLAAVHHYSVPQTHGFNTPYQLSIIPPRMRAQASVFGGSYLEDYPRDASVTNVQMQHGDVLMLATDGVFDNLNNQDILKIVSSRMLLTGAWTVSPESGINVSDNLCDLTRPGGLASAFPPPSGQSSTKETKIASLDYRRDGPFAKEAQRYYPGDYYRGGKVDDICVLVLVAVDESIGK